MNRFQTTKQTKLRIAAYIAAALLSAKLSLLTIEAQAKNPIFPSQEDLTARTAQVSMQVKSTQWTVDKRTWHQEEDLEKATDIKKEAEVDANLLYNTIFSKLYPEEIITSKIKQDPLYKQIEAQEKRITKQRSRLNKTMNIQTKKSVDKDVAIQKVKIQKEIDALQDIRKALEKNIKNEHSKKQEFLKRVVLALACAPLAYRKKGKKTEEPWPFALATSLNHGQRILFKNSGINGETVYKWLLEGKTNSKPDIDGIRPAASHAAQENKNNIVELKLGLLDIPENLAHGIKGHHRFVNIPFGGIGNEDAQGKLIGFDGFRTKDPKIQHGHVYIFVDTFSSGNSALLIGIETSAPGKRNMFGKKHSLWGGFTDPSKERCITGGKKMKPLLSPENAPDPLGGMIINMNNALLTKVERAYVNVSDLKEADQQALFKKLLLAPADVAKKIIDMDLA